MILVRSPLRVTFGGGGTDLPAYYQEHGGFAVSAAIQKYIYVAVVNPFTKGIYLKTNEIENVATPDDLHHALIRECLKATGVDRVAITTFADIPAGTGLGSSSSLTVALLKALHIYVGRLVSTEDLARLACEIEIERCGLVGGKQDQYSAAYGGINAITFNRDGTVDVEPLTPAPEVLEALEGNLTLTYTGVTRNSTEIQATPLSPTSLHVMKGLGVSAKWALEFGMMDAFGRLLERQWEAKKARPQVSPEIDALHDRAIANGALGAKLVGAGGGGFIMSYGGVMEGSIPVRFDFDGTKEVTR